MNETSMSPADIAVCELTDIATCPDDAFEEIHPLRPVEPLLCEMYTGALFVFGLYVDGMFKIAVFVLALNA